MVKTHYVWDFASDSYLMETNGAGATTVAYTNEPIQYGKLISTFQGGTSRYFHFDAQQSTRQLTDENQNITDDYTYSAFGENVFIGENTATSLLYKGALGYYYDHACSSLYVRRRILQPELARWLSRDDIGFDDGPNEYTYTGNDPIGFIDPSGKLGSYPCSYKQKGATLWSAVSMKCCYFVQLIVPVRIWPLKAPRVKVCDRPLGPLCGLTCECTWQASVLCIETCNPCGIKKTSRIFYGVFGGTTGGTPTLTPLGWSCNCPKPSIAPTGSCPPGIVWKSY